MLEKTPISSDGIKKYGNIFQGKKRAIWLSFVVIRLLGGGDVSISIAFLLKC